MIRLFVISLITFSLSFAHDVKYSVFYKDAVVIKVFFPDGTPFAYEAFEIYSPANNKIPYQVGRTDKYGRIVFIPDKIGNWTIKVFSENGHGFIDKIYIKKMSEIQDKDLNKFGYLLKIFIGILILFLIYGLIYIATRRKKP